MTRWVVFDKNTAAAVRSRVPGGEISRQEGVIWLDDVLDSAAQSESPAVLVLPSSATGEVLVVRMTPQITAKRQGRAANANRAEVIGTGFLGLADALDEDETPPPAKNWWQKIWD